MGLFNWFKSTPPSNVTELDDLIWLNNLAKLNGISQAVSRSVAEPNGPDAIILVAHFRDCLTDLQNIVQTVAASGQIIAISAENLKSAGASGISIGDCQTIHIVVGERHPLLSHEDALLECANRLPCRSSVVHHVSLEDAVMRAFAGEWVQNVLKGLGMSEDQAIQNHMVDRRIRATQQKLGRECVNDFPADSAEEWMERNCPAIWAKGQS